MDQAMMDELFTEATELLPMTFLVRWKQFQRPVLIGLDACPSSPVLGID